MGGSSHRPVSPTGPAQVIHPLVLRDLDFRYRLARASNRFPPPLLSPGVDGDVGGDPTPRTPTRLAVDPPDSSIPRTKDLSRPLLNLLYDFTVHTQVPGVLVLSDPGVKETGRIFTCVVSEPGPGPS